MSNKILCSCIVCRQVKSSKGIHSHYIIAHTPRGKEAHKTAVKSMLKTRAMTINPSTLHSLKLQKIYYTLPNKCQSCGSIIPYNKRHNKFCNHSCSAAHTNKQRHKDGWRLSDLARNKISNATRHRNKNRKKPEFTPVSFCSICKKAFAGKRYTCSEECLNLHYRNNALRYQFGHKGIRQGKSENRPDSSGRIIRLESSYEIQFAKILDSLNIKWIRPKPLPWTDKENKVHNYYPDFYLLDYQIYFDPKNDYLIKKDADKISRVIKQNKVKLHVVNHSQLNESFVRAKCGII